MRKAVFDILGDYVRDATVLELFAGSGALGIEALSRGAKKVFFVDDSRCCIETIKRNIPPEVKERSEVFSGDWLKAVDYLARRGEKFNLIILDPPYKKNLVVLVLKKLQQCCILLEPGAIIVAEHHRDETLEDIFLDRLRRVSQKRYGDTAVSVLKFCFR